MTRALLECDIAPDRSNTTKDCCMKRFSFKRRLLPANIQTRICSTTIICHHGEKQRKTIRSKAPPLILITAELQVPSAKCERPQAAAEEGSFILGKGKRSGDSASGLVDSQKLAVLLTCYFFKFSQGRPLLAASALSASLWPLGIDSEGSYLVF